MESLRAMRMSWFDQYESDRFSESDVGFEPLTAVKVTTECSWNHEKGLSRSRNNCSGSWPIKSWFSKKCWTESKTLTTGLYHIIRIKNILIYNTMRWPRWCAWHFMKFIWSYLVESHSGDLCLVRLNKWMLIDEEHSPSNISIWTTFHSAEICFRMINSTIVPLKCLLGSLSIE